ncbi:MAG: hypothetical protein J6Y60_12455 [Treponema sp.]|nr:hypothetical protein [Treponema sp.]
MVAATKQEVMNYLDQMDESSVFRVLLYAKSLFSRKKPPKSPYGKFKTAEEYAEAQKLWNEFEELCQPSSIPEDYDYKKAAREARWRKYESLG